jgi:hypothetical protein
VVEAEGRDAVARFVAEDPFVEAAVWREVLIDGFVPSMRSPKCLTDAGESRAPSCKVSG